MLLIDGVKYELWTPSSEDEFEQVVKEHTQDIFGEQSIYLDRKQKLKSLAGIGSIPDGYVIILGDSPHWHIVEVELSSHPLHEHIVSQVSRFITGTGNPSTQREIARAIYNEITRDGFLKLKVEQAIQSTEIYKFLSDLISEPPTLTIIIEKDTPGLREAISTLAHPQIKVVEFQTFAGEGLGLAVHAHLFEPLYPLYPLYTVVPPIDGLVIDITPGLREYHSFDIPHSKQSFFPAHLIPFELETDIGIIETNVAGNERGYWIQRNLKKWWDQHPEIKVGDKLFITVIEPMKKYHLEISKD